MSEVIARGQVISDSGTYFLSVPDDPDAQPRPTMWRGWMLGRWAKPYWGKWLTISLEEKESKMLKTGEIRIKGASSRGDIIISASLHESEMREKTRYESDAEKLVDLFWKGLPFNTVKALTCLLVETLEDADFGWWENFKKEKGWIE